VVGAGTCLDECRCVVVVWIGYEQHLSDNDDVPDLADTDVSQCEDELIVQKRRMDYLLSVRAVQVEQRLRDRRKIADSDDDELDQPVQKKKAVRKLELDKLKQRVVRQEAGEESDAKATEDDRNEEECTSSTFKVARISWQV
jgi:hypothetical protein